MRCADRLAIMPGVGMFGGLLLSNNAALAAQRLRDAGLARVAVLDVDYHHGNGTQDIFWERADVLVVSIHGDPDTEYPFFLGHETSAASRLARATTTTSRCPEAPTGPRTPTFEIAFEYIAAYSPQALVVSLGVDTFEGDPISQFRLGAADSCNSARVSPRSTCRPCWYRKAATRSPKLATTWPA